jgi:hypothetical protein
VLSDEGIVSRVSDRLVPLKLFLGRDREATRRYRPFWTPTLYFLDPDGTSLLDWPGVIPKGPLQVLLDLGEAMVGLRRGRFQEAVGLLDGILEDYPDSVFAPEALWWSGVVRHVVQGDDAALERSRRKLKERYPDSPPALRV